jgi:chromosome segregation ATPase
MSDLVKRIEREISCPGHNSLTADERLHSVLSDTQKEITRLTALVAEQQRKIEEGEKRIADLHRSLDMAMSRSNCWRDDAEQAQERIAILEKERDEEGRNARDLSDEAYKLQEALTSAETKYAALQLSACQMKEALEKQSWWLSSFKPYGWKDAAEVVDAALQSAASIDLGYDWRKETEKLAEALQTISGMEPDALIKGYIDAALADYRAKGGVDENA